MTSHNAKIVQKYFKIATRTRSDDQKEANAYSSFLYISMRIMQLHVKKVNFTALE